MDQIRLNWDEIEPKLKVQEQNIVCKPSLYLVLHSKYIFLEIKVFEL